MFKALTDEERRERLEALMARRQNKRLKVITTHHQSKHSLQYELIDHE